MINNDIKINKAYKEALLNAKNFSALSSCRHLDFPNNLKEICLQNLFTYFEYYKHTIPDEIKYKPKGDYVLVSNILNCLTSVKSRRPPYL